MKITAPTLAALVLAGVLTGAPAVHPASAAELTVGLTASPTSVDPQFHVVGPNSAMARNIFDGLVRGGAQGLAGGTPLHASGRRQAEEGTDWNDYAATHGKAAMRALIQAELRKQGIELPAEITKPAKVTPGIVTQAIRDADRKNSTRMALASEQAAARDAARQNQQRAARPRV